MALEYLPFLDRLTNDIEWTDEPQVFETRFAFTTAKGTLGRNPFVSRVSLTWKLRPDEVSEWLSAVNRPLQQFKWQSDAKGWVVLRPTGPTSWSETGLATHCSITFERLR